MEMEMSKKRERKIVVAVDESEESMKALSWCLSDVINISDSNTNKNTNTTLILLYVKPSPPAYSSLDVPGYLFGQHDVVTSLEEQSRKLVDSVMSRAQEICNKSNINNKVEKKVGSGDAKDVICRTVEKLGADLLVMGTHDYGFFKRALLGSVSYDCAKRVKCPVMVVKQPKISA